ncbi:saccharopine dehydrogenase-like NADP-dependent oxidoreductase [Scopulibacillus daqui]|uniref:Saccharopine dehydrogenase-like NADP-dependent oxidoreductase n=1 Tax=Scopulibacillus daqui TaxID=1469162 RepID=A0ABS2Q2A7_9BACL|nr:saccharopine dehydrogenase C-terminal domain-containing protein [Scopulibacillus daqui]MBM7646251.1 saccharopine dehydrogenase-like NADP-dependent oxidoreductase [Scopulibacillus daqui]
MKAAVLGVGGVGQVFASEIVKADYLDQLLLGDIITEGAEKLAGKLRRKTKAEIVVKKIDAGKVDEIEEALRDIDVVLHAGLPAFNFNIMEACARTKTNYIDMACASPQGLKEQLQWNGRFKAAGILGIMGLGCDPGFSNIAARYAVDQMDQVDEILIRDGDNSKIDYEGFCSLFSPQTAIEECLAKPNYWTADKGLAFFSKPFANKETFEFPEPIGPLECYSVEHEEATTLGDTIGKAKGCKYVDFKYALAPEFVNTVKAIGYLGLDSDKDINIKGTKVVPKDVVVANMPKPTELAGKVHGYSCIGAVVKGIKEDKKKELFVYTMANHDEIYEKTGYQATVWQTGLPPAVAVDLLAQGKLQAKGCIPPELIDPVPFLTRLKERGMYWDVIEKTSPVPQMATV